MSVWRLSKACQAGQEILLEKDDFFFFFPSGSSPGNGARVDQPLVDLALILIDYTDSQKIQLRKKTKQKHAKIRIKVEKTGRAWGSWEDSKEGKQKGKVHVVSMDRKKMAQMGTSSLPANS